MQNVNTIIGIASMMPESFIASPGGVAIYTFRRPRSNRGRFHLEAHADGSATATVSYTSDRTHDRKRRRIIRLMIGVDDISYTIRIKGREFTRVDRLEEIVSGRALVEAVHAKKSDQ